GQNLGYSLEKCLASVGQPWSAADWYEADTQFATTGRYRNCTPGSAPHACIPDGTAPILDSVTFYSANQCQAYFNEALNATSANTAANYSLDNGFGAPSIAAIQGDNRTVRLTFASSFLPNTYTLTVNNVTDLAGNPVAANSQGSFVVTPPPAGIIFTEIMPNPNLAGTDTLHEWIEIYNGDVIAYDLQGWSIGDVQNADVIEGSHIIGPGEYFVFACNGDSATNGGVPEDYDYENSNDGGISMSNNGETLYLRNASSVLVASVNYTGYPYLQGHSCQLSNVLLDPANPVNWCTAQVTWSGVTNGDFGTPGATNVCSAPQVADSVSICQIRQQTECGVSTWLDSLVITRGVITYSDSCRRNMYVEANGCAVLVFGTAARTRWAAPDRLPLPGDSVRISGSLMNYNGLTEFNSTALYPAEVTLITTGNPVPSAVGVPASAVSQLAAACSPEQYESRHIEVQNVSFDTTGGVDTFLAATNFYLKNGSDSVTFRIDLCDTLVGKPIPVGLLNVTGILSQFDAASCYCESYQLVTGALAPFETAACLDPANLTVLRLGGSSIIELRWLPGVGQPCACYNVWYAASAEAVFPAEYTLLTATPITATTYQDALGADAKRFYVVEAVSCP
ncbi:lamin tail domain-containing protein, partial [bacterium]|nr:lamin tail domain-containing protein [bacterium]